MLAFEAGRMKKIRVNAISAGTLTIVIFTCLSFVPPKKMVKSIWVVELQMMLNLNKLDSLRLPPW